MWAVPSAWSRPSQHGLGVPVCFAGNIRARRAALQTRDRKVWRIQIILPGNAYQREQGITPGIGAPRTMTFFRRIDRRRGATVIFPDSLS
jgi:hypothetical protein